MMGCPLFLNIKLGSQGLGWPILAGGIRLTSEYISCFTPTAPYGGHLQMYTIEIQPTYRNEHFLKTIVCRFAFPYDLALIQNNRLKDRQIDRQNICLHFRECTSYLTGLIYKILLTSYRSLYKARRRLLVGKLFVSPSHSAQEHVDSANFAGTASASS